MFDTKVDWNKPIEAVRKFTGEVVPVTFRPAPHPSRHYDTNECPNPDETNTYWREDGSDVCHRNLWYIRNVSSSEELPADWAIEKALKEAKAGGWTLEIVKTNKGVRLVANSFLAHARCIEKYETPPPPPVSRSKKIVNAILNEYLSTTILAKARRGSREFDRAVKKYEEMADEG